VPTDAPTALHRRVYDELVARIADGRLPAGGRLPPERRLCEELDVSRATLRKALAALAKEGTIVAVQGRGTYAAPPRLTEPPNALLSFSGLAATKGLQARARVLAAAERPATISEGELFGIAPGAPLFELERLRMLDGLPVAIGHSLVPLGYAPELVAQDWTSASLYEVLSAAGSAPTRASYAIEARAAEARAAELLGVPVGAPVLVTEATSFALDGRCVEDSRLVYRGDRYRFRSTLTAPHHTSRLPAFLVSQLPRAAAAALRDGDSSSRILIRAE
jgi:GntR family transcriptional regulator